MTELRLTETGPGSRAEIVAYVREVLEQRTVPNDDTDAEKLAKAIVTSVLSRLGAGYAAASNPDRVEALEQQVTALDERVKELEQESRSRFEYEREMRDRGE
jgi:polyhydroxyalkanoate synthesis regulator phasin